MQPIIRQPQNRPQRPLTRVAALLTMVCALLAQTAPARAEYEYFCLKQNADFSASLILEMMSRENPDGLDSIPSASEPVWTRSFFDGMRAGKYECVYPADLWKSGDRIRVRAVAGGKRIICGSTAAGHPGFFLIPDKYGRKLEFQILGDRDHPQCLLTSQEVMHSECGPAPDAMRNMGCEQWSATKNPMAPTFYDFLRDGLLPLVKSLVRRDSNQSQSAR